MNRAIHRHKLPRRQFLARASGILVTVLSLLRTSGGYAKALADALTQITGRIVRRHDEDYFSWWGSMSWYVYKPKRYPEMIVQARNMNDVAHAIDYARSKGWKVSVRSSGHNMGKAALREGGLLLDVSRLNGVTIDPRSKTAWVEPGVRSVEFIQKLLPHNLTFPAAHTGMVGLGGYLLGGGMGWNIPELGMACRSIVAAEIITADGNIVHASRASHPDLLWAVRGAGPGFFGVVTRYQLQLYPTHPLIRANKYIIPIDKMDQAVNVLQQIGQQQDKRLEIFIKIGRFHPVENTFAERDLVCTVSFIAFADSDKDAQQLLQPVVDNGIRDLSVVSNENITLDYMKLHQPVETDLSSPLRTTGESVWTDDPGQCLLLLSKKMQEQPPKSPRSFALCGWGFNHTLSDPSSCLLTAARHYIAWIMIGEKEQDIDVNYNWMDDAVNLLKPLSKGHYINEIDPVRYPHHVKECFSPESWENLDRLRAQYDPHGLFHTYLGQS